MLFIVILHYLLDVTNLPTRASKPTNLFTDSKKSHSSPMNLASVGFVSVTTEGSR